MIKPFKLFSAPDLIFVLVILLQFYLYNYASLLFELPQSIHMWRQTDSLSFALNYFQNGMDFFKPQIHHALNGEGYTAAEFPLMYYLVAICYHIFGPHEWVFRSFWVLLLFLGLFSCYKTIQQFLKDSFWAIGITALLFSSPVLVYYGINFIIDPAALSLIMIAWYMFSKYIETKKWVWLIFSSLFFLLSGLSKEPALISYVALVGIFVLAKGKELIARKTLSRHLFLKALLMAMPTMGVVAWYFIKVRFNEVHTNVAFLAQIMPIWKLSTEEIDGVLQSVVQGWSYDYFNRNSAYVIGLIALVNVYFLFKGKNGYLNLFSTLIVFGSIAFFILFFWQFKNHDYYIINVLLLVPITILAFIKNTSYWTIGTTKKAIATKLIFVCFFLYNLNYAIDRHNWRYEDKSGWIMKDKNLIRQLKEARSYLPKIGINRDDKIMTFPDPSTNITLYLLNQPGWPMYEGNTSVRELENRISKGAKYIVVFDSSAYENEYLKQYLREKIGAYKGIDFYRL